MRILIVEDERALCDAIARSLRNLAYSVDCCHDGQEALDLLNVEAFDLEETNKRMWRWFNAGGNDDTDGKDGLEAGNAGGADILTFPQK